MINRARTLQEIFRPSSALPVPLYHQNPRRSMYQNFSHHMPLLSGMYDIQFFLDREKKTLNVSFTKDNLPFPPDDHDYRSFDIIQRATRDLIHVIRAIVQIAMKICQENDIASIAFTAEMRRPSLIKFYDRLAGILAKELHGEPIGNVEGAYKRYTILFSSSSP